MQINIKKLEKSQIEIEGVLPPDQFEAYRVKALEKAGSQIEIPGFRKGHIPEDILISQIGEMKILEEMAGLALNQNYPKILSENKIDAIGEPIITITKLARKNPFGFKMRIAIMPEIKLGDYKKIASAENKKPTEQIEVSLKEVEDTVLLIRRSFAEQNKKKESEIAIDDLFAKSFGSFENLADLKTKLKENIRLEKENNSRQKKRVKVLDEIIEKSEIDAPDILIEAEKEKMFIRLKNDLGAMNIKFEDYLKNLKKTEDELKNDWQKDAFKIVKLGLILGKISQNENLKPENEQIDFETNKIMGEYKDADRARARMYVEEVLTNEKVLQFLEGQSITSQQADEV